MNRLAAELITQSLDDALRQVASGNPVIVTRNGKDLAVLVPIDDLPFWKRMSDEEEDRFDLEEATRRLSEVKEEDWIPLNEVRRKAGLL